MQYAVNNNIGQTMPAVETAPVVVAQPSTGTGTNANEVVSQATSSITQQSVSPATNIGTTQQRDIMRSTADAENSFWAKNKMYIIIGAGCIGLGLFLAYLLKKR